MKFWLWLLVAGAAPAAETYSYWVEPCSARLQEEARCQPSDPELAVWALQAWERASGEGLRFTPAPSEGAALIRFYWAPGNLHMYGEARPILVGGRQGAAIYVRPDLTQLGPGMAAAGHKDPTFRDAIVYLTCLHESGHAIGLAHTANYQDIMYSFQYGGDLVGYFQRYRRQLRNRNGIPQHSGISGSDRKRLRAIYGR